MVILNLKKKCVMIKIGKKVYSFHWLRNKNTYQDNIGVHHIQRHHDPIYLY